MPVCFRSLGLLWHHLRRGEHAQADGGDLTRPLSGYHFMFRVYHAIEFGLFVWAIGLGCGWSVLGYLGIWALLFVVWAAGMCERALVLACELGFVMLWARLSLGDNIHP